MLKQKQYFYFVIFALMFVGCGPGYKDFKAPFYTSTAFPSTAPSFPYEAEKVMDIESPSELVFVPATQNAFVITWLGRIFYIENFGEDGQVITESMDFTAKVSNSITSGEDRREEGAFSIVLDPNFAINGYIYISYASSAAIQTIFERYTFNSGTKLIDEASVMNVLTVDVEERIHKGGHMLFDAENYLVIGTGDGGTDFDSANNAQNLDSLKGKILRVDVSSLPYLIPPTNPFVGDAGVKEEIFAYGFRHPWRFSINPVTQELWVGDVGSNVFEELDIVKSGKNYGWPRYEGFNYIVREDVSITGHAKPIAEFERTDSDTNCIIGGEFYYGATLGDIYGKYLFEDCRSGLISAVDYDDVGKTVVSIEPLAYFPSTISSMKVHNNDVYILSFDQAGAIYKLNKTNADITFQDVPQKLSKTGLFKDVKTLEPEDFLQEYEVISPLWSDGAEKYRWIALPKGERIHFDENDPWTFPKGTILVKHFEIKNNQGTKRLETRVMFRHNSRWQGYSYAWNEDQTEAYLTVNSHTDTVTFGDDTLEWYFPDSQTCVRCHTEVSGTILGVGTLQINKKSNWKYKSGYYSNQLKVWDLAGLFSNNLPDTNSMSSLAAVDASGRSSTDIVKSYLHSNCSHCHQPGGPTVLNMDLRYKIPLQDMNIVNVVPSTEDFGLSSPHIVEPGNPDDSTLWIRINNTSKGKRMPPLSTAKDYDEMFEKIREWIENL